MAFKSILTDSRRSSHRSGRDAANEVAMTYTQKAKDQSRPKEVVFYVGVNLAKKARFMPGDLIDIQQDTESGLGLFTRTANGHGRKLGPAGSKNYFRISTRCTDNFPFYEKLTVLEGVAVQDEGIVFVWPK